MVKRQRYHRNDWSSEDSDDDKLIVITRRFEQDLIQDIGAFIPISPTENVPFENEHDNGDNGAKSATTPLNSPLVPLYNQPMSNMLGIIPHGKI